MKVQDKLWQNSAIGHILDIFTGKVLQKLSGASKQAIDLFPRHLDHLFRRWYFLRLSETDGVTPFSKLDYYKLIEGWPKTGQFLIKPELVNKQRVLQIDLDVDYIDFWEQPLLSDSFREKTSGDADQLYFKHDKLYSELVKNVRKNLHELKVDIKNKTPESFGIVWSTVISVLSQRWRMEDPFMKDSFSLEELIDLNQTFLKQASRSSEEGIGSDELYLAYVGAVRKKFPDWGYTISELEEIHGKGGISRPPEGFIERMKTDTFLSLGINMDRFFLTPLTIYLNLIEPFYHDLTCWELDFDLILNKPGGDSEMMLSDPPSSFRMTGFGTVLVQKYL